MMGNNIVSIRLHHGNEFENTNFDELYGENGISHNLSALKIPQKNRVMERKMGLLKIIARILLIASGLCKVDAM